MKTAYILSILGASSTYGISVGQIVQTSSGTVQGHAASVQSSVSAYLGIPYAEPPVGNLRFMPPIRYHSNNPIDGSSIGYACPAVTELSSRGYDIANFNVSLANLTAQGIATISAYDPAVSLSEDCLTLNVWVPTGGEDHKAVIVYIYGGSYTSGSTQITFYDGQNLAAQQDVIIVTLNYRLDILGFHGDPASIYHNPGFLDQRMAVEWVRDNIAAFGGDISRITLMGQSAGAASVDHYAYSWTSEPIVSGLILESGTAGFGKALPSNNADKWYAVSAALGCGNATTKSSEVLTCLQSRNITDLLKAKGSYTFKPTVDNITGFPNYPALSKAGRFAQLPILIGNNDFETGLYIPVSALNNVTDTMVHWETQANTTFACPAGARANISVSHGLPTWRYRWFGNFPNTRLMMNPDSGAYHCSEVPFIWDTLPTGPGIPPDTKEEISIRGYIQGAWAAFAKNPSHGLSTYRDGWPQYSPFAPSLIRLAYGNITGINIALPDSYDSTCLTTYPISGPGGLVATKSSTTCSLFSTPSASGDVKMLPRLDL